MADTEILHDLLRRARSEIADELESMVDSYRGWTDGKRQTDEQVLADTDHETIDDPAYRAMNRWRRLIDEIDAALADDSRHAHPVRGAKHTQKELAA